MSSLTFLFPLKWKFLKYVCRHEMWYFVWREIKESYIELKLRLLYHFKICEMNAALSDFIYKMMHRSYILVICNPRCMKNYLISYNVNKFRRFQNVYKFYTDFTLFRCLQLSRERYCSKLNGRDNVIIFFFILHLKKSFLSHDTFTIEF